MSDPQVPTQIVPAERLLTAAEFHRLAEVPPEFEWFANLTNPSTKRAYECQSARKRDPESASNKGSASLSMQMAFTLKR